MKPTTLWEIQNELCNGEWESNGSEVFTTLASARRNLRDHRAGLKEAGMETTGWRVHKFVTPPPTQIELLEAATCAWEYASEQLMQHTHDKWGKFAEWTGSSGLRLHMCELAEQIHIAYTIAQRRGYDEAFDWEFVPAFLQRATDENLALVDDWRDVAAMIGRGE